MNFQRVILRMCKALILCYVVMLVCMLLTALAIWKLDLNAGVLKGTVIGLYVICSIAGGLFIGKMQKEKKFLWGLCIGCLFFLVLFLITVLSGDFSGKLGVHFVTAFIICALSGTLGGMLA